MTVSQDTPSFGGGETERLIRETAREVADGYDDAYWRAVTGPDKRDPAEFWQECADAGFLGTTIPQEYGGEGLGITELSAIVEELTRHGCFGSEMLFVVNVVFGAVTLAEHGSEEQKREYLPALADGDLKFCMALTEPNAGHNAPNMDTYAEETDAGYEITGSKQWISGADRADRMLLVARTTPLADVEKRTSGITLFLADPGDDAIELRELDTGIPTPERQFELSLDGYEADEEDIIGTKDMGLYQLFDTVNPERIVGAAGAVGTGYAALERAADYAREREVFGQPIGAHQAIQHPIADSYSKLEAANMLVRKSAWMMDADENRKTVAELSNMAKLRASEAAHEATDVALQVHGGNGFSKEYGVIEMWKGTRLSRVAPGSTEMMRNHIAEHTLDLPRSY
ncbi:acyl-CoA dehydrogenase [Halovenus sp. WSH3]|uniref:Acyl-CoA dehydrogenase n=1 Tax=Halovenus carboxidivorans TaxID=2692199 RepID=A0A6B0T1K2_9EURY|nr:acyl-CoA dehydrogenase family protein [Halovenus carboxidivorans]MXR51924.1 acyl-CoA dehydrogenase [Halovenus carboxidivorans]